MQKGKAYKRFQKALKKANEDWISVQYEEINPCLNKINSKKAYKLVKALIHDKSSKCQKEQQRRFLADGQDIAQIYNHESLVKMPFVRQLAT